MKKDKNLTTEKRRYAQAYRVMKIAGVEYPAISVRLTDQEWEKFKRLEKAVDQPERFRNLGIKANRQILIKNMLEHYKTVVHQDSLFAINNTICSCPCGHIFRRQDANSKDRKLHNIIPAPQPLQELLDGLVKSRTGTSWTSVFRAALLTYDSYVRGGNKVFCDVCLSPQRITEK